MKKSDKIKYQKLTLGQLQKELEDTQKKLFELKTKHHLEPVKDTSLFKKYKLLIRYLMALLNQKQNDIKKQ